jgi:hydroxymethylpyrimidine pyrophosphatase-like HAD family hydrolase
MRYRVLATDYDGTLATHGEVEPSTAAALRHLVQSGRKAVLVTGRLLHEIQQICAGIELFDMVIAENGAVLWSEEYGAKNLAPPVPLDLVAALRRRGVTPLNVGSVICSTWSDHEETVRETVKELGLDVQLIPNKGALMILPADTDKGTGLAAGLKLLRERPAAVVAVGDAENDLALFEAAGFSAAVANALPAVKAAANMILSGAHGAGVEELIEAVVSDDLESISAEAKRAG